MLGIYCRRSGNKDKSASIETQQEEGIKFANENGFEYQIFSDSSISGTKNEIKDRPAFARLYDGIAKGTITSVYVIDQSRIERNSKVWNLFVHAIISNNCTYYPNGQLLDLDDPNNKFVTQVMSAANELYASLTSQKVTLAFEKNAKAGKTHGMTAYGFTKSDDGYYEVIPEQAEVVQRIYQLSLEGNGTYTIANILNNEGVPTKFNGYEGTIKRKEEFTRVITEHDKSKVKWRGNVVYDMIINTAYKGKRKWKDSFYDIPAIVTEDLWDKANRNLSENKKKVGRKSQYNYLLNGLIFCAHCGKEYRGKKRPKGNDNSYKCKGRSKPNAICTKSRAINIPKIETFLIKHLFENKELKSLLDNQTIERPNSNRLKNQLSNLKKNLVKLEERISLTYDRLLDPEYAEDIEIKSRLKTYKEEKVICEEEIITTQKNIESSNAEVRKNKIQRIYNEYSAEADFDTLKKLVHGLVQRIEVLYDKDGDGTYYYLIQIDYKLFDERIIFVTNRTALKWSGMSRYRKVATSNDELQEDILLSKELNWKMAEDFKGLETSTSAGNLSVEFSKDEFVIID